MANKKALKEVIKMPLGAEIKEKILGVLSIIVVVSAVAQMWPILSTQLGAVSTELVLLNVTLVGLIFSIGVLMFIVDYFL
jgi:hypothetical protein